MVISLDLLIMIWFVNDYEMFFFGKIGILGVCLVYYFVGIEWLVINCFVVWFYVLFIVNWYVCGFCL